MFFSTITQRTYNWTKRKLEIICGFQLLAGIIVVFFATIILNKYTLLINYFLQQQNYSGFSFDNNNNKPKPVQQPQYTHGLENEIIGNVSIIDIDFSDLRKYLTKNNPTNILLRDHVIFADEKYDHNPSMADVTGVPILNNMTNLEKFQLSIRKHELYRKNDTIVQDVLDDMAKLPIKSVSVFFYGMQLKFELIFTNGARALFKAMRFSREQQTFPNHFYFNDFERPQAEIATFHLDRILDFRRAAPVVGRKFNITSEFIPNIRDEELLKTFFTSPAKNKCFYGYCRLYCDINHPFCGNGDIIEGSVVAMLPAFDDNEEVNWKNPWKRSYHHKRKKRWENDDLYCEKVVMRKLVFRCGRRLLDIMDLVILDFLIGNKDRHHYETFRLFGRYSSILHMDHGRGFGNAFEDDISILKPLIQCCAIRESTLKTLLKFYNGPIRLSQALRNSLKHDPIAPVLWEPHLISLDRRVNIILNSVQNCIAKKIRFKFKNKK